MQEFSAAGMLANRYQEQIETQRPHVAFLNDLHDRYGIELDSLVGLNAMTRPYKEQQLTIGEQYYGFRSPAEVMEVNRTAMNVWLFDLIQGEKDPTELELAYTSFTAAQREKGKLSFEEFCELKTIVDDAVPPEQAERFRAMLVYSDLGKATRMQEYMQEHRGHDYADHDKLLLDVLEDQNAIRHCMPSFLELPSEDQAYIRACFKSGFHLGQYQKLETLPIHLLGIQALPQTQRDAVLLTGLFDIAGALGDKVQNGTPILDSHTFQTFKKARASVHAAYPGAEQDEKIDPIEQALFSYESYMAARNTEFDFDLSTSTGRALLRFVCMFRVMKPDEAKGVPRVFEHELNDITQQLFVSLLDATGFEANALWIEYGPALARNMYATMTKAGCSFEEAMSTSMTLLARITNSARKQMARGGEAREPATIMAAPLAHIASDEQAWQRLLQSNIVVRRKNTSEYAAEVELVPKATITNENRVDDLSWLKNDTGTTLFIGVGGGSDSEFARFAAETVVGDVGAPVVSFPGVKSENIRNAIRVSEFVYLATPETNFKGMRTFEDLSAKAAPCYVIADVERGDQAKLNEAYDQIAAHVATSFGKPVTQIITVDSGGDIFELSSRSWNRDIASLQAAEALEAKLGIEQSHTLVFVPGVGAPQNLNEIVYRTSSGIYQLANTEMRQFLDVCSANQVPTHSPKHYSQLLNIGWLAMRRSLENQPDALEPLRLPLAEVLGNNRPAYGAVSRSMTTVIITENRRLRALHAVV